MGIFYGLKHSLWTQTRTQLQIHLEILNRSIFDQVNRLDFTLRTLAKVTRTWLETIFFSNESRAYHGYASVSDSGVLIAQHQFNSATDWIDFNSTWMQQTNFPQMSKSEKDGVLPLVLFQLWPVLLQLWSYFTALFIMVEWVMSRQPVRLLVIASWWNMRRVSGSVNLPAGL